MTICLIDGDILCYRACEDRNKRVAKDATGKYPGGLLMLSEVDFTDEENEKYLNKTYKAFKRILKEVCEMNFSDTYKMAVAGNGNYREDLFPEYKANRHADPLKHNPFVPLLRLMAIEEGLATPADGMEADDLIRIWAEECRVKGEEFTVCSIDKDLKMIEGSHYLIHKREFFESTPEFAMRFYYEQLLMGDLTDNIQGAPGIGPIKAKALLEDCEIEEEFQNVVQLVYFSTTWQWRYALQLTGQLIYLKKHADDWFDFSTWSKVELIDIIEPPKNKSKKKMETWTIKTALEVVNPRSITAKARWESAMEFLMEATEGMEGVFQNLEILTDRDNIPKVEIDAYDALLRAGLDKLDKQPPEKAEVAPLGFTPVLKSKVEETEEAEPVKPLEAISVIHGFSKDAFKEIVPDKVYKNDIKPANIVPPVVVAPKFSLPDTAGFNPGAWKRK